VLDSDRQFAQPLAGRVKDRAGDCRRRGTRHRHLAQALDTDGIGQRVGSIDEANVDFSDVGVHWCSTD
jgi:hypothetical protein